MAVLDSIGLDKTAFAAEAYSSNYVKHYFDCHAWVQESLPYDADQILYDIIKFVMPSPEGFIPDNNEATVEKYLEQLINGGFVGAGKRSDIGRINTCSIPGRCSPALLTVVFEGEFLISPIMDQEVRLRENVKRFTAHRKLNDFAFLDDFDSFLHSLLYLTSGSQYLDPTYCEKICKMFKFLRVLDLGSLVLIRYPSGIENLFLLRYLKLNIPSLKSLPSSRKILRLSGNSQFHFSLASLLLYYQSLLSKSLCRLSCLESLKLANESKMPRRSNIILAEYQFPPSLTHLSFSNIELMDDPIPALEKLSVLQVLKLKQNLYSEERTMGIRAMPKLECLIINPYAHLKRIHEQLWCLKSLNKLELWWPEPELRQQLREFEDKEQYGIQLYPYGI
ncbi:hypothetical protein CISIN_1g041097mg [Citrus sinensis]|uniref:NB-ARC domain-containing protein n=1 Tax=Citrus sinensis TaxID=2711 RepID=A0A067DDS0_CITSI|nr:hypothetical protein CISIN_1g041097mg [Citrus sinensis]